MLQFDETALKSILKGVKTLAKAVIVTLGPKGRNVLIKQGMGKPLSTKDGVTVAKEISLKDKFENIGAQLVLEASTKTADYAGDGTTTAIVLAEAIFSEGVKNVIAGANPMSVKRGIELAVKHLVEALDDIATPISTPLEIEQIATISANNDPEIGQMIAKAMEKVGLEGIITTAEARGLESELDIVEGMRFDKGYLSPYFVTNGEKMTAELTNGLIFITDQKLSTAKDIVPILEAADKKPLLLIADDIEGEALATLVVNKLKGGLELVAVKAPAFGDRRKALLDDLATLTGATVITQDAGLSLTDITADTFGTATTLTIEKDQTTLLGGKGDPKTINDRANQIRAQINDPQTTDYDRQNLEKRLASLVGGVAVLHVGAPTEGEMKEKKMRVEDALSATRAAAIGGIVPGGGVALLRAITALEHLNIEDHDEQIGLNIVKRAAKKPIIAIATNCGRQGDIIAEKVAEKTGPEGYNGLTDTFENLLEAGVIDPVLVTKSALKHASSIASLLITVACMVTDKPGAKEPTMPPGGMPPGMGGMGGMGGMPGMGGMGGMGF